MLFRSIQEVNKISPKDNSDTLFDVTYTDAENIDREITVKEIVYDSDVNYIEKTRKNYFFFMKIVIYYMNHKNL